MIDNIRAKDHASHSKSIQKCYMVPETLLRLLEMRHPLNFSSWQFSIAPNL
jgi:hypothetical protein